MRDEPLGLSTYVIRLFVKDNLPYGPRLILPNADRTKPDPPPEPGAFHIPSLMPKTKEHHTVLGEFIDYWGQVESALMLLFSDLLGAPLTNAVRVHDEMGMRQRMDAIKSLATLKLTDKGIAAAVNLIERVSGLNSKRNLIAHGHWMLSVTFYTHKDEVKMGARLLRAITPADFREERLFNDVRNQKVRTKHSLSVRQIVAATGQAISLIRDIFEFRKTVRGHLRPESGSQDQQGAHLGFFANDAVRTALTKPVP